MRGTRVQDHMLLESRPYELATLQEILRLTPTGILVYEPVNDGEDFRILFANPAIEATKPFRRMQGRTYSETWPEVAHIGLPGLRGVLHTGEPWIEQGVPLEVEVAPGEIATRFYTYRAVRAEVGGRTLLFVFVNDVSREQRVVSAIGDARAAAQREAEISNSLLRAANEIAALSETGAVAATAAQVLLDSLGHSRASVFLVDLEEKYATVIASKGERPLPRGDVLRLPPVARLDDAIRAGEALVFDFHSLPARSRELTDQLGSSIALIAPVQQAGSVIGVLSVDDPGERREFTGRDVAFAEGIASQAAVAIQNARSLQSVRERSVRWRVLAKVAELTSSAMQPSQVIEAALGAAEELLGAIATTLWTFDERRELIRLVAARRFPAGFMNEYEDGVPVDAPFPVAQAVRQGAPVLFERIGTGTALYSRVRDAYARYGIPLRSLAAVPLIAGGRATGVMTLAWDHESRFDEGYVWFLTTLADHFSRALENAHAVEDRALQTRFSEALNRVNETIHATLSPDEIMRRIVEEMSCALDVDVTVVQFRREGHRETAYVHGVAERLPERLEAAQTPLSAMIEATGEPIVIDDITADDRAAGTILAEIGLRSVMGVPLFVRSEVVGAVFAGRRSISPFGIREIDFAREAVTAASLAMENASLYETQQHLADRLQQALLSLPETVEGLEFAHEYRSATTAARVGGDFYDVFQVDDDHVGVLMGDVAGKGLEAAVLTSMVRNVIRSHLAECRIEPSPAGTLGVVNEVLFKATSPESFVTVFFGILDCRSGILRYVNAGHTTPLLIDPEGTVTRLGPTGSILGAFVEIHAAEAEARFMSGGSLVLYTDGLTEARRGTELYGEERVERTVTEVARESPERVVREVMQDVLRFGEGELSDDVALLVVKRTNGVAAHEQGPARHEDGGAR